MDTWIHSLGSPDYSWAAPVWRTLEVHQHLSFFHLHCQLCQMHVHFQRPHRPLWAPLSVWCSENMGSSLWKSSGLFFSWQPLHQGGQRLSYCRKVQVLELLLSAQFGPFLPESTQVLRPPASGGITQALPLFWACSTLPGSLRALLVQEQLKGLGKLVCGVFT